jgi:hypothetical protein
VIRNAAADMKGSRDSREESGNEAEESRAKSARSAT